MFTSWYWRAEPANRMCSSERIRRSGEMGTPEVELTLSSADSGTGSAGTGASVSYKISYLVTNPDKGMRLTSSDLRGRSRGGRHRKWDCVL